MQSSQCCNVLFWRQAFFCIAWEEVGTTKIEFTRLYKIDEFFPTEITPNFYIFVCGMKRVWVIVYWQSIATFRQSPSEAVLPRQ